MADELTVSISMSYTNGGVSFNEAYSDSVTVAAVPMATNVQSIGTTEGQLDYGGGTSLGFLFIKNLDATNFVQFGKTTGVYTARLKPGELGIFRMDGNTVFAKADTAAVYVYYKLWSN